MVVIGEELLVQQCADGLWCYFAISGEKKPKSREKILSLLRVYPEYSAKKLSEEIGVTQKAIEKQLAKLKAEGRIKRNGPDKGGSWEVI